MARHKNLDWDIPDPIAQTSHAELAVLMDIRDELRAMRARLDCPETLAIPGTLARIARNTTKKKRGKR